MKITATMIWDSVGVERSEDDRVMREQYSISTGGHRNALKLMGKFDISFAGILCSKGFGSAQLLKPGVWSIGGYYYYPRNCRWSVDTRVKATTCESFDDFICTILGDTTFCKVDKK